MDQGISEYKVGCFSMNLPNIKYNGDITKLVTADDDKFDTISYMKDAEYFFDSANYSKFIKEVEKLVRHSDDYSDFVRYIKRTLGMNFCQVSSKITDDMATIEMHHGPLFTLYDVVEVILNWFIKTGTPINTMRVANKVLDEHFAMRVQIIMLTITNHEAITNRDLFTHINQGIGNVDAFIKLYAPYLQDEQKYKIWNFLNLCENSNFGKSFDRGYLDIDWIKRYIKI